MERGNVKINNPERFMGDHKIPKAKLEAAIKKATDKIYDRLEKYAGGFPENIHDQGYYLYNIGRNNSWISGMHTGTLLLAYELTGKKEFLDTAIAHIPTYYDKYNEKRDMDSHDVGFAFSPSMVALYKLTGNEEAKKISLMAAEYFYNRSYISDGEYKFIVRAAYRMTEDSGCRTMMDTLLNVPFLYWATQETGDDKYAQAAREQYRTTADLLIRPDGSSYHHYQFDVDTHAPVKGVTLQGNRDESTWGRGHSWGVYGLPVGYDLTGDKSLMALHNDVAAHALNNLPSDNIYYWDFDFTDGSDEPRDTSTNIISACGLLEAIRHLPADSPLIEIYENAANMMMEAVIDKYTDEIDVPYDGLMWGVTGTKPEGLCIEACAVYADFFYLEALMRLSNPDWKRYW